MRLPFLAAAARPPADPSPPRYAGCEGCGRWHRFEAGAGTARLHCVRCDTVLRRLHRDPVNEPLAMHLAGLLLYLVAITMPLMELRIGGASQPASLLTGIFILADQQLWALALVVAITSVVAPALKLGAGIYVLAGVQLPHPPPMLPWVFRSLSQLRPWSMVEVYLLGLFVAYVKLIDLATVEVGAALWALGGLMLAMAAADAALDPEAVWQRMERRGLVSAPEPRPGQMLLACHSCGFVSSGTAHPARCPRCAAALHLRKPDSLARAWALLIAATILYVPANIFPVMTVIQLGQGEPDTILSGVIALAEAGMWPLALLVCFASFVVPMAKILILAWLLLSTRAGSSRALKRRTYLYHVVEAVGRWSMIDIFMVSTLAALVRLGSIATIEPGFGAVAFAGVVVLTMLSAMSFDPRLMWDRAGLNAADTNRAEPHEH